MLSLKRGRRIALCMQWLTTLVCVLCFASQIKDIVEEAVQFADNSPSPDPATAGDSTFAPAYDAKGVDPLTDEELAAYARALKIEFDREARKAKGERVVPPPVENDPNPPIVID